MKYRVGKSFTWPGTGVHLELASLQIGDEGHLDPIAEAACKMMTPTLHFFAIFPAITGAFEAGPAAGRVFSSAATLCLQYYQEKARFAWLTDKTLRELRNRSSCPEEFQWDMAVIPWPAKDGEMGEAIFLICGTAKDFEELTARLAKETKDE